VARAAPSPFEKIMIYVIGGQLEKALKVFRHDVIMSGVPQDLKIRSYAKPSARKKAKALAARRRRLSHQKRRFVYQKENDKE
jgi:ribosomal protein S21